MFYSHPLTVLRPNPPTSANPRPWSDRPPAGAEFSSLRRMPNALAVVAALLSVGGAVVTAVLGARFEHRRQLEQRRRERQDLTDRYSAPLLHAAASLSSRLREVGRPEVIAEFTRAEGPHARRFAEYGVNETLYRIGRYLCWAHVVSREIRGLELGDVRRTRSLILRLTAVRQAASSREGDRTFMLLGGEQDAIGEVMLDPERPAGDPACIGYVTFVERLDDPPFARWFEPLKQDVVAYVQSPDAARLRLRAILEALDELIKLLDPDDVWLPLLESSGPDTA